MNDDDIQATTKLLSQLKPGFLPYPIFLELARLIALPIVELVPLRQNDGTTEVLLLQRADDDPFWPKAWHTPGSVIRATDFDAEHQNTSRAMQRIISEELQGTDLTSPQFVSSRLHDSKRGVEQAEIYWAEVIGEPKAGSFYDLNQLPENLIQSQLDFITEAAAQFKASRV